MTMPDGDDDREWEELVMNGRMCIVSRRPLPAERLVRFVADPAGRVVPDLKRRLPGRGAHVEARRDAVELAVKRRLLGRALKRDVSGTETLAVDLDALLVRSVTGALAMARKAGQIVTGAAKVDAALRTGKAVASIHASDAAPDGVRKLDGARHAGEQSGRARPTSTYRLLDSVELGLAFGTENVIHAAVLSGDAGSALLQRFEALRTYRGEGPDADEERTPAGASP
ncbi:MAG: RNA-binding protein [Methylobacterium sp.]